MKKLTTPSFLVLIVSLFLYSCKKEKIISNNALSQEEIKFFNHSTQTDPLVQRIVDSIYYQNQNHRFIVTLTKEIGFPLWDKSEVVHPTGLIKNTQVVVPFVFSKQKEVSAFLICNMLGNEIAYRLIVAGNYESYGFGNKQNTLDASSVSQILMYFNYKVWGDSLFLVNDSRILNSSTNTANRTSLAAPTTMIKITPQPIEPKPILVFPKCDNGVTIKYTTVSQDVPDPFNQDPCTIWITTSEPITAPNTPSVPGGGNGNGSGGSTSSPEPWWSSSKSPCIKIVRGKIYFDVPGCTTIPPITAMTDDVIKNNNLQLLTTRERQVWDEIYREEKESNEVFNKDCQGTNRTGNIQWPGTMEHWMIMIDYMAQNPISGEVEYQIPGSSAAGNRGYADIVNKTSREIYEIKPNNEEAIAQGKVEVDRYVAKANVNCPPAMIADGGGTSPWRKGTTYAKRTIPNPKSPNENIIAELNTAGLIVYSSQSKINQPVPIVIPQSVLDKLKNLLKKLKESVDDYETVIAAFLRENPELVQYLKGAAYTAAITIIVGTIVEDFATLGAGIADDWASFLLAYRIIRFAYKL